MNRVSQKYNWLAHYHNQVVKEIGEEYLVGRAVKREQLLITPAEMPSLMALPQPRQPME